MIGLVIERLLAEASFASVQGAEEMDAIGKGVAPPHGACFVLPFREEAQANDRAGGHLQRVEIRFLVAFVVRVHGGAKGGQRISEIDGFKNMAERALAGWVPDDGYDALYLVAGQAASLGGGAIAFVQTWASARYLEKWED